MNFAAECRRIRNNPLLRNIGSLYAMQFSGYLAPLVIYPYLARVLTPSHLGLVALSQSLGLYVALIVEFGFTLSATRLISRNRSDRAELGRIFAGVIGAKVMLALLSIIVATVVILYVPAFGAHRLLMCSGALAGVAQGGNVAWFYQGLERMRTVSVVDISAKALFALSVFLLIHGPSHDWAVPCIQCFWYGVATLLLTVRVYREFPVARPTIKAALSSLRFSGSLFLYRGSLTLYTTANTIILGLLSSPVAVGYYSAGEKINNVFLNLGVPATQALYPRMSYLVRKNPTHAKQMARITLLSASCLSLLTCISCYLFAPSIVHVGLGAGYEPVIPVLRILVLALPFVTCSVVMGCQCMLPLGMDRAFNAITILAGMVNVTLASFLVPHYAHIGMAWSLVVTEFLVAVAQFIVLLHKAPHFLMNGQSPLVAAGHLR